MADTTNNTTTTTHNAAATTAPTLMTLTNTAKVDLASLSRVSHRVAMIDNSERLQQVIDKLLPRLLQKIGDNHNKQKQHVVSPQSPSPSPSSVLLVEYHQKIHAKLIEIISHIMKRVRDDTTCMIPTQGILDLLLSLHNHDPHPNTTTPVVPVAVNPFTLNLSLAFLTMGCHRMNHNKQNQNNKKEPSPPSQSQLLTLLVPGFMTLVGDHADLSSLTNQTKQLQASQMAHLLLRTIQNIVQNHPSTSSSSSSSLSSPANKKKKKNHPDSDNHNNDNNNNSATTTNDHHQSNNNNTRSKPSTLLAQSKTTSTTATTTTTTTDNQQPQDAEQPQNKEREFSYLPHLVWGGGGGGSNHHKDQNTNTAVFELLIDALLYQTVSINSTVPPCGLSQFGHERLVQGTSIMEKDWRAEMSSLTNSMQYKLSLLEFVVPCKKYALFMPPQKQDSSNGSSTNTPTTRNLICSSSSRMRGISRTVAMMVIATGDTNQEVSKKATTYLKMHLDSCLRDSHNNNNNNNNNNTSSTTSAALGDPLYLAYILLSYTIGQTNAESIVSKIDHHNHDNHRNNNHNNNNNKEYSPQLILSMKRRATSETTTASILSFVTTKVFEDHPHIFDNNTTSTHLLLDHNKQDRAEEDEGDEEEQETCGRIQKVGTLAIAACSKIVSTLQTSHGLSLLRAKPYIAATKLLNILCIRLSSILDKYNNSRSSNDTNNERVPKIVRIVFELMEKSLQIACSILAPLLSSSSSLVSTTTNNNNATSSMISNEGNIAIRDACYGVICTLSRSRVFSSSSTTTLGESLFSCGKKNTWVAASQLHTQTTSIETATLLFGCVANEEDNLRPRAVAALDALLGAYSRIYNNHHSSIKRKELTNKSNNNNNNNSTKDEDITTTATITNTCDNNVDDTTANPWSSITTTGDNVDTTTTTTNPWSKSSQGSESSSSAAAINSNSSSNHYKYQSDIENKKSLSRALLPLLWSSSQRSKPKALRLSSARWSKELLKELDLTTACHLLCFLAGDTDTTTASVARDGLHLPKHFQKEDTADTTAHDILFGTTNTTAMLSGHGNSGDKDNEDDDDDHNNKQQLPDFGEITPTIFQTNQYNTSNSSRPTYNDFSFSGKAAAIRFVLNCLMNDIYGGGEDSSIQMFVNAMTETLALLFERRFSMNSENSSKKEVVELLDECSICFSIIIATSRYARTLIVNNNSNNNVSLASTSSSSTSALFLFSLEELEKIAMSTYSSVARRHLAAACGHIYTDDSIWKTTKNPILLEENKQEEDDGDTHTNTEDNDLNNHITKSQIYRPLQLAALKLNEMKHKRNLFQIGEIHGAAFLGAYCIRALRLKAITHTHNGSSNSSSSNDNNKTTTPTTSTTTAKEEESTEDSKNSVEACWNYATNILSVLGNGLIHSDEFIGNAFSDCIAVSLSYSTINCPILDTRLYEGTTSILNILHTAITKYASLDHLDPSRVTKLARSAGICLASSTSGAGFVDNNAAPVVGAINNDNINTEKKKKEETKEGAIDLGPARLKCADALFSLLGSPAFRKDEEIALVVGEALASYADACGPHAATWNSQVVSSKWPNEYCDDFAQKLPPHQHVLFVLLRKIFTSSSPHTRNACAPALLAVVARASKGVNQDKQNTNRFLVREIVDHLREVQTVFITLLSDPKTKHLSRESCCLGLVACRGLTNAAGDTDQEGNLKMNDNEESVATDELNSRLLKAFGQTANYGGSAMQESRAQAAERRQQQQATSEENQGNSDDGAAARLLDPFGIETTEVGGVSGMGEASLGAYREMAAAAVSLGRPDILYSLLLLSVSNPIWCSPGYRDRYNSSSLLGDDSFDGSKTNTVEMRTALRPHLGKLLPKILRACHDPNKQTREQMTGLWSGLTGGGAEARQIITEHLFATTDSLIKDASSKLWRVRFGACSALSEILVGRSWSDLGGGQAVLNDDDVHTARNSQPSSLSSKITAGVRFLRLWTIAMRALDDVRINVRESGDGLSRTLRALTIRLCNPALPEGDGANTREYSHEYLLNHQRNASYVAATTLRWLIKHGLSQKCEEATGFCVSCLVEVVGCVRPGILQPLVPGLLRSLLFAISGLEPSVFNYLQVRSSSSSSATEGNDGYNSLERLRLQMAQSGPLATAVTKCLDMLPNASIKTQKEVIPELDTSLRTSVGFATRAATADAVSALCVTCPNAFRFPGNSNTNPSVRLLRALYFASEKERGQVARDKMTHALGNLAALCPGASVRSLAIKACQKYNRLRGNYDDPASRRAAASSLRAIAVRASDQFSDGGKFNIWCKRVLPVSYLGQKDPDSKVAALWKEVWDEGGSVANSSRLSGSDNDFGTSIEEYLLPYLVRECVNALEDVSWSRRIASSDALIDLCSIGVLSPCNSNKLGGIGVSISSTTNTTTVLPRSQRRAHASGIALKACIEIVMRPRIWTGKSKVLNAAVKIAGKWVLSPTASDNSNGNGQISPITVASSQNEDDLFVGDSWFKQKENEMDLEDSNESEKENSMDIDSVEKNVKKIDFEECDEDDAVNETEEEFKGEEESEQIMNDIMTSSKISFDGICRFLIEEAIPPTARELRINDSEEYLPYRASAFRGFHELMSCLSDKSQISRQQKKNIFKKVSNRLFVLFDSSNDSESSESSFIPPQKDKRVAKKVPPLLIACSIDCISVSLWEGIGTAEDINEIKTANVAILAGILKIAGGKLQPAWTVRESAALCVASLASRCHQDVYRENYSLIPTMIQCAQQALRDRKFWRVRLSGIKILKLLVGRVGSSNTTTTSVSDTKLDNDFQKQQLMLEIMLPHKEEILKLVRSSLSDAESKITALSSEVLSIMSWWP